MADRSEKTIIFMPVFNRKATASESILNMRMVKGSAHLKVIDDRSTQFDGAELVALGDSGHITEQNLGIDGMRMSNLAEFVTSPFDYCYFTDSDTLHDPMFLDRAFQMFDKTGCVSSLYNSSSNSHRDSFNIDIGDGITIRRSAPGVSMFFDKPLALRMLQHYLDAVRFRPGVMKDYRGWDWFLCSGLPQFAVSQVSYLEHIYADGLHVGHGVDVAMNPTPFLRMMGEQVFKKLGVYHPAYDVTPPKAEPEPQEPKAGLQALPPEYFYGIDDREIAKALFKQAVHTFTMEISSKCNRRCAYCPNSQIDRISENKLMPWSEIERIAADLEEVAYDGVLSLHNYNEPTLDDRLPEIIAYLRGKLPKASIGTTTNGDYLNRDYLQKLADAGMSYLRISPHTAVGQDYNFANVLRRVGDITDRIGLKLSLTADPARDGKIDASWTGSSIRLFSDHADYTAAGNDRGGSMDVGKRPVRTAPCLQPLRLFYILYNGDIVPCCHINSDMPGMEKYVAGNFRDYPSVFQAYASEAMAGWRRSLYGTHAKSAPCATCVDGLI